MKNQTVIDGLQISAELVAHLKDWAPKRKNEETYFESYFGVLTDAQTTICSLADFVKDDDAKKVLELMGCIFAMRDDLAKFYSLLPICEEDGQG